MFSKIKNTVLWASILSIPVAIAVFAIKYYQEKSQGKDVNVEEAIEDVKEFVKGIISFVK